MHDREAGAQVVVRVRPVVVVDVRGAAVIRVTDIQAAGGRSGKGARLDFEMTPLAVPPPRASAHGCTMTRRHRVVPGAKRQKTSGRTVLRANVSLPKRYAKADTFHEPAMRTERPE